MGSKMFGGANFPGDGPAGDSRRSGQADRADRTYAALLAAAETIFARDGFEASRIEDIAAEAGRSRGAFYANFASKSELFLALRGVATRRRAREIRERLESLQPSGSESERAGERSEAIMAYLLQTICDTRTLLLQVEFKLFALRHPEMLAELAAKHLDTSTSINRDELADLFPEKTENLEEHRRDTLAIEALLEGFALNALFSPEMLDRAYLEEMVPKLLATILPHM